MHVCLLLNFKRRAHAINLEWMQAEVKSIILFLLITTDLGVKIKSTAVQPTGASSSRVQAYDDT